MTWNIPQFLDNSNKTPIVEYNKNSGEIFYLGEVIVTYVAKDQSKNVNDSCAFKVEVKGKSLDFASTVFYYLFKLNECKTLDIAKCLDSSNNIDSRIKINIINAKDNKRLSLQHRQSKLTLRGKSVK